MEGIYKFYPAQTLLAQSLIKQHLLSNCAEMSSGAFLITPSPLGLITKIASQKLSFNPVIGVLWTPFEE